MSLHNDNDLPLWRSKLILPVNVEKFVAKAHTRGADAIVLDLEDSIAPADKASARGLLADAVRQCARGTADVLVRINRPLRLAVPDIEAAALPEVRGLVLPKVDSASHVRLLAEMVDELEAERGLPAGQIRFALLIETADAFWRMREIASAHPRVVALSIGGEDITLATHAEPHPEVLFGPSQQVVFAAAAAGILPLGMVGSIANYQDIEGSREAIRRSRRLGFEGASCIHPAMVPLLNEGFGYGAEEIAKAERIVAAFEKAKAEGRGSASVDGRMIDIPVVARAERVLRLAARIRARTGGGDGGR
jgi:citrate lyase subunit beta/citryl-CoA lyase